MKKCPQCSRELPDQAEYCPFDGHNFKPKNYTLPVIGLSGLGFGGICVITSIILLIIWGSLPSNNNSVPSAPTVDNNTVNVYSTSTQSFAEATSVPTPQRPKPTLSTYWCDDLQVVKLDVGDRAKIVWPMVNLRSTPKVPNDFYENIVDKLEEGETLSIIGGPECAHNGTWWEVRTDSGQIGWMREYISTGYLMQSSP